jgi:hypothetical protein
MATTQFTKEFSRFAHIYKLEVLNDVLANGGDAKDESTANGGDSKGEPTNGGLHEYIKSQIEKVSADLATFDKKNKMGASKRKEKSNAPPRPMSAYNKFIKKILPAIKDEHNELSNKERMTKASEKWKKLTVKEKEAYKYIEFEST